MRRLIGVLLLFIFTPFSFALTPTGFGLSGRLAGMGLYQNKTPTTLQQLQAIGGLTFYKDFTNPTTLNADYSIGSGTATFTATRTGATVFPGMYIDANGVYQTTAAVANTPRYTNFIYGENGLIPAKGLLIEPSKLNYLTYSYSYENAAWTATNITVHDNAAISPDGTQNASTFTATDANGTVMRTAANGSNMYSVYLKRKTGTGKIYITVNGTTWRQVDVFSGWAVFSVMQTYASTKVGIKIETSGDELYVWNSQYEDVVAGTQVYFSSPILTTSAQLTRGGDKLKYVQAGNRTVSTETMFATFIPMYGSFLNDGVTRYIISSDADVRNLVKGSATGKAEIYPNATANSTVKASSTTNPIASRSYTITATCDQVNSTEAIYVNGILESSGTTAFAENSLGTSFYVGSKNDQTTQIVGVFQNIGFFNKVLSDAQVASMPTNYIKQNKILCVGDSITQGNAFQMGYEVMQSYLPYLQDLLGLYTYDFVGSGGQTIYKYDPNSSGVTGNTIAQAATRLTTDLGTEFATGKYGARSKVLIHIGTNGLLDATGVSQISGMIDSIVAVDNSIPVYVALIIPKANAGLDATVTSFNTLLNNMLVTYKNTKSNLYIVDCNTAFKNNASWSTDYLLGDGIHPNKAGATLIASTFYAAMQANGDA